MKIEIRFRIGEACLRAKIVRMAAVTIKMTKIKHNAIMFKDEQTHANERQSKSDDQ